jgi:hypothetical protein
VVCLNGEWTQMPGMPEMPSREPMMNEVLTIRDVLTTDDFMKVCPRYHIKTFAALLSFEELGHDWLYASHNFRPLVDGKSEERDVALFRHHLHQRQPERV